MSKYENLMNKAKEARERAESTRGDVSIFFYKAAAGLEAKARALTIEEAEAE
jgi:hypothetical protein